MSKAFTPALYMAKARRAAEGARISLKGGDTEGACSRAYYAMFDAVHAALRALEIETHDSEIKTHTGLLTVFSKELIQTKQIPAELRKAFNQVQQLRQIADYSAEPPDPIKALWAVEQAEAFLGEIEKKFMGAPTGARRRD